MPLDQPIAKGANLRVRDATRWEHHSKKPIDIPACSVFQLPSGSPVDSEPATPSSEEEEDVLFSPLSTDSESLPDLSPRRLAPGKLTLSGLLPNNKSAKGNLPSPALSSGSDPDYFSHTFLDSVLPESTAIADAVTISQDNHDDSPWSLAMLDNVDNRILYAKADGYEGLNMRENLVDLLDLADEQLDCDQVVVVLDKNDAHLGRSRCCLIPVCPTDVHAQPKSCTRSCTSVVSSSHPPPSPSMAVTLTTTSLLASTSNLFLLLLLLLFHLGRHSSKDEAALSTSI